MVMPSSPPLLMNWELYHTLILQINLFKETMQLIYILEQRTRTTTANYYFPFSYGTQISLDEVFLGVNYKATHTSSYTWVIIN